jgi:heparanase
MNSRAWLLFWVGIFAAPGAAAGARVYVSPQKLPRVASVDERYQSYDLDLAGPAGAQAQPPVDLSSPRLRKLAAALGPAYLRVRGTADGWKDVVDFARAVDARIVASFAAGSAADEASGLLASTRSMGGEIAAVELFEPAAEGAAPGPDTAAFAREVAAVRRLARQATPHLLVAGPGWAERPRAAPSRTRNAEALLGADPRPLFDVFTYRYHGAVSSRCGDGNEALLTTADQALSEEWLSGVDQVHALEASLRDRFQPGKPIWVTEIADATCGGNPWASSFLDTFRYVDQLARLAKRGVKVHMHDSLASGESALVDGKTLAPRSKYWAALLWRRLMGTTVLDAGPSRSGLHLYAHCLRGHRGGVAILAINNSRNQSESIELPVEAERYTLWARKLQQPRVDFNGSELRLQADGELPDLHGVPMMRGTVVFVPASITFLAVAKAANAACRQVIP